MKYNQIIHKKITEKQKYFSPNHFQNRSNVS